MHSMGRIIGKDRRTTPPDTHEVEDAEGRVEGLLHLMNTRGRMQREG